VTIENTGLLRTGQTAVYRAGDDGFYRKGVSFRYRDNGDGTVSDLVTGLVWARDGTGRGCAFGQLLTWYEAIDWAENLEFAGYDDWRLPNRRELDSLVDAGRTLPALDTSVFPNLPASLNYEYWTSSTVDFDPFYAWYIGFDSGHVNGSTKNYHYLVRAVRGGRN